MLMRLGKCVKSPADLKQYTIEYVHWLNTDEVITDINYEVEAGRPSLVTVDGVQLLNPTKVIFFVGGGDDGHTYKVVFTITTSAGQIKQDHILFQVSE